MSRTVTAIDRLAALLIGLVLVALGAGMLVWRTGLIAHTPDTITLPGPVSACRSAWWPWETTTCGLALLIAGVFWLQSHRPSPPVRQLALTGSSRTGQLSADLKSLADTAAAVLARHPAVRSAKAKAVLDRGAPSIRLDATATSADVLVEAARAADEVATTATAMLGDTIAVRTRLHVDTKRPAERRVA